MNSDPNDVVRVAAGDMVVVELYKQALIDEGIDARVLGEALEAGFGTALQRSVEVWVHASDAPRARAIIRRMEAERGETVIPPEATADPTA